jgi:hypothetical protein
MESETLPYDALSAAKVLEALGGVQVVIGGVFSCPGKAISRISDGLASRERRVLDVCMLFCYTQIREKNARSTVNVSVVRGVQVGT